ncbi:amidotransferase subunit B, mitochondrial [Myxozyma melibiosi]|uniref:Glutamyl-tRNA(Gln) amidotransferase subunit B, mitochondrial n=1 Tax=Myxozyma melibiosi TaxID=54550 RepID=A0ABR1F8A9_9ASCO
MTLRMARKWPINSCSLRVTWEFKRLASTKADVKYPGLKCGLEIHLQLKTSKKLFSASQTSFQDTPNSNVSLYDVALPGTQPQLNHHAVLLALKAAIAMNCKIQNRSSFDRKHYFYADQPAGYQITQFYNPIAKDGYLRLLPRDRRIGDKPLDVGLVQIQLEQDTGKSTYAVDSDAAYIDFNRTNHPLIEIVTAPDLYYPEDAGAFVHKLQLLVKQIGVSSAQFQAGEMRVDVNVSVNGGQRCEIKNLASVHDVVHAIKSEYKRQLAEEKKGTPVTSHTLGWDGKQILIQRPKEQTSEYRYIPDPELPPLLLSPDAVEKVKQSMPKLPDVLLDELSSSPHSLRMVDAQTLLKWGLVEYYFEVVEKLQDSGLAPKLAANWIVHHILGLLGPNEEEILSVAVTPQRLADMIKYERDARLSKMNAMNIVQYLLHTPDDSRTVDELMEAFDLKNSTDQSELVGICENVLKEHEDAAEKYAAGKKGFFNFLVGMVMKQAAGKCSVKEVRKVLDELLEQRYDVK